MNGIWSNTGLLSSLWYSFIQKEMCGKLWQTLTQKQMLKMETGIFGYIWLQIKTTVSLLILYRIQRITTMWVIGWNTPALPVYILLVAASFNAMLIEPGPQTLGSVQVTKFIMNVNYNTTVNRNWNSLHVCCFSF